MQSEVVGEAENERYLSHDVRNGLTTGIPLHGTVRRLYVPSVSASVILRAMFLWLLASAGSLPGAKP